MGAELCLQQITGDLRDRAPFVAATNNKARTGRALDRAAELITR